jgi:hypothetical protein
MIPVRRRGTCSNSSWPPLGFMPSGNDVASLAAKARAASRFACARTEHRPALSADESPARLCRHHQCDGRTLHLFRTISRADPARNRQARTDFCRRRLQSGERRRSHRRRREPTSYSIPPRRPTKSIAHSAAWKRRHASMASLSASPRRARPRSTALRNGPKQPRTAVSSWCRSAARWPPRQAVPKTDNG